MTVPNKEATAVAPLREPTITVADMHIQPYRIFGIQSTKGATDTMMAEIMYQLDQIPGVSYTTDDYGNLYATKGKLGKNETYPAYVCHTDTVHKIYKTKQVYRTSRGKYFAMCYDDGPEQIGIGGDDYCGIICNIELLWRLKKVKCAFFLDEENGCLGSAAGNLRFFDDCRYAIQIDRKGHTDIVVNGRGVRLCSEEFETAMNALGEVYGYKSTDGRGSDVIKLKERGLGISCVNLSAGYYKEHTKQEYVVERDLLNVLEFCIAISKDKKVYPHVYKAPVYVKSNNYTTTTTSRIKRICKACNKSELTDVQGVMCSACLDTSWKSYKLRINETTGTKVLIIEVTDLIEDNSNDDDPPPFSFGASDTCVLCQTMHFTEEERNRGYCFECGLCKENGCANVLTEGETIKSGYCHQHLQDTPPPKLTCGMVGCYNTLNSELERLEKICDACVGLIRLKH